MTVLHIASWYPNPWDSIEGNFVRDQVRLFAQEIPAEVIMVQVRSAPRAWPRLRFAALEGDTRGYVLLAPVRPGVVMEWLATLLLVVVLLRERAWRFDALHFHIAYPLLMHARLWHWIFRRPIVISEHWSAYHYKFHLPEGSRALKRMQRPFRQGYPVLAVSKSLLDDIRAFAQTEGFEGHVLPNVVPLHGASGGRREVPVLFAVNRWVEVKNPLPMLEGLNRATEAGLGFRLIIGGYGPLVDRMTAFVENSALQACTTFIGRMTKAQIAEQLAETDGYLFSSDYETFSVACAEALGAGVPLIGPHIPAIAEYAGSQDWVRVPYREAEGWSIAVRDFVQKWTHDGWGRAAIAHRAEARFSEATLRLHYRQAMQALGWTQAR